VTELKVVGAEGFKNPNGVSAQDIAASEAKVFDWPTHSVEHRAARAVPSRAGKRRRRAQ